MGLGVFGLYGGNSPEIPLNDGNGSSQHTEHELGDGCGEYLIAATFTTLEGIVHVDSSPHLIVEE